MTEQSNLTPAGYRPRILDARIATLLKAFGGVEITGAKWCGKTWSALSHAASWDNLMDAPTLEAAQTDPSLVLLGNEPHLVDEWQEVPSIWDAARNHIDRNANRSGQIILTGSAQPKDTDAIRHSGTGRIARVRLRPMSIFEQLDHAGGISLSGLFDGQFDPTTASTTVEDVARWCCRGGWPSILSYDDEFALETPAEYVKSIVETSVVRLGKKSETALDLLRALALNAAQAPTLRTLANDMGLDGGRDANLNTVRDYLEVMKGLYLVEDVPGWAPPLRSKKRVRTKPKHYFVDPSIPATLLNATPTTLLRDMQTLGFLFETLVVRDVRIFVSAMPGAANRIGFYRDEKGLEADLIIELTDGRWAALEIKLSDARADDEAAHKLLKVARQLTSNPAARTRQPSFLGIIVGKGNRAWRRDDGVYVLPLETLEP